MKTTRTTFRRKVSAAIHEAYIAHGYSNTRITAAVMKVVNKKTRTKP